LCKSHFRLKMPEKLHLAERAIARNHQLPDTTADSGAGGFRYCEQSSTGLPSMAISRGYLGLSRASRMQPSPLDPTLMKKFLVLSRISPRPPQEYEAKLPPGRGHSNVTTAAGIPIRLAYLSRGTTWLPLPFYFFRHFSWAKAQR